MNAEGPPTIIHFVVEMKDKIDGKEFRSIDDDEYEYLHPKNNTIEELRYFNSMMFLRGEYYRMRHLYKELTVSCIYSCHCDVPYVCSDLDNGDIECFCCSEKTGKAGRRLLAAVFYKGVDKFEFENVCVLCSLKLPSDYVECCRCETIIYLIDHRTGTMGEPYFLKSMFYRGNRIDQSVYCKNCHENNKYINPALNHTEK